MFGSDILDVAIGLIFVFFIASLLCSAAREALEAVLKTRALDLERGIRRLLHDPDGTGIAKALYSHPLIDCLYPGTYDPAALGAKRIKMPKAQSLPSYIPAGSFSLSILDLLTHGSASGSQSVGAAGAVPMSLAAARDGLSALGNPQLERALSTSLESANGSLPAARANIEAWFNSAMDRISGAYKRRTQLILFLLGLFVAIAANVNVLVIADRLWRDKTLREAIVAEAGAAQRDSSHHDAELAAQDAGLAALALPIGWASVDLGAPGSVDSVPRLENGKLIMVAQRRGWWNTIWSPLFGWLLTAFAVTLGAPFWFDLLNRFTGVRSTLKPKESAAGDAAAPVAPASMVASMAAPATPFIPHEWSAGDPQAGVI